MRTGVAYETDREDPLRNIPDTIKLWWFYCEENGEIKNKIEDEIVFYNWWPVDDNTGSAGFRLEEAKIVSITVHGDNVVLFENNESFVTRKDLLIKDGFKMFFGHYSK